MSLRQVAILLVAMWLGSGTGLAAPPAQQSGGDHHRWQQYGNAAFRYVICYPADIFTPQPAAADSSSRTFLGPDGATLTLFGRNNARNETGAAMMAEVAAQLADGDAIITNDVRKPGWFVISGHRGPQIFYAKGLYAGGRLKMFELTYPGAASDLFEPIVKRLSGCFANTNR